MFLYRVFLVCFTKYFEIVLKNLKQLFSNTAIYKANYCLKSTVSSKSNN